MLFLARDFREETVRDTGRVDEGTHNISSGIDAKRPGRCGAWEIDRKIIITRPKETVRLVGLIGEHAHNFA
jgi:hypothetical protein